MNLNKTHHIFTFPESALAAVLIGAIFLTFPLHAEIIILKDGTSIEGRIIGQNKTEIRLRTASGTKTILKKELKSIKWVRKTDAQKKAEAEALRKKREAELLERERIQQESEQAEKERLLKELEEKIQSEKAELARIQAERAAALRELVETEKMEKPDGEPISYWDFAWRSMVLPGWGHFHIDRPVMGSVYLAAGAGLLVNTAHAYNNGLRAQRKNEREVRNNFLMGVFPSSLPSEYRMYYSYQANIKALTVYERIVDRYNHSLYLLEIFYSLQLLHIIYNGFSWEKGLLVDKNRSWQFQSLRPALAIVPEIGQDHSSGTNIRAGVTYIF